MKKLKVKINRYFPQNGNEIFWKKWKPCGTTDVVEFKCRPTVAYQTKNAFTFVFGNEFSVKFPIDKGLYKNPDLGQWITAISNDGIKVQIEVGGYRSASYNFGDPLPDRYYVESISINGEKAELYKYVDRYYPWVKRDMCAAIRLVKNVFEIYRSSRIAA